LKDKAKQKDIIILKDHLSSIKVTVDEAGEIVSHDDYDAWGMVLVGRSGNDGFPNDKYTYAGKERDVETGCDYFGVVTMTANLASGLVNKVTKWFVTSGM